MSVADFTARSVLTALMRPSALKRAGLWRNALPVAFAFAAAMWGVPAHAETIGPGSTNQSTLTTDSTFNVGTADTLVLNSGGTLTYNLLNNNTSTSTIDADGFTTTLSGVLSGTGSFIFTNSGNITLTNTDTYSGTTTINGGATLLLSSGGSISNSIGIIDYGTFDISGISGNPSSITTLSGNGIVTLGAKTLKLTAAAGTFSGAINDSGGGLEINGGTETLTGPNTYSGATTIDTGAELIIGPNVNSISSSSGVTITSGTLDATAAGATIKSLSGSGSVLLDSQTLKLTNAGGTFSGNISGNGGNLQIHIGTETLTGTNGYTGVTTIDGAGRLNLAGTTGDEISASSGVTNNGIFDISGDTNGSVTITDLSGSSTSHVYLGDNDLVLSSATGTYAGVISDTGGAISGTTGGLQITGSETLSGVNTYAGDTTINALSYLHIGGTGSLADSTVVDNGTFDIAVAGGASSIKSLSGSGSVTLGGNTLTLVNAGDTFDGVISGASGSLALTAGAETLTGTNTYSGSTAINGGTLALSGTGGIEDSSSVTVVSGAAFDISQTSSGASIKTLAGAGHVDLGDQTLTLTNASTTFSGILEDGGIGGGTVGKLTLDSTGGTETLTGANTYHGTTTINDGTLRAGIATTFSANSDVVLNNIDTAILNLNNYDQTIKSLSGGTVALAGDVRLGTAKLTITNGGTFNGTISGSGADALDLTGGTLTITGSNTYTGTTTIESIAELDLTGSGNISQSSLVTDDGTFSISGASSSVSIKRLAGASTGIVTLGGNTLSLTNAADTFSGIIGGTGGFTVSSGSETLSTASDNTYSGLTTIGSGATLTLTGDGTSILASSGVNDQGTFVISGNGATSIKTLYGNGVVQLGGNTLTLTAAGPGSTGSFSGYIHGSGGLTITGGTETLSGNNFPTEVNDYGGATTITSGTLKAGVNDAFSAVSAVSIGASGVLDLNGHNETIYSLGGTGSVTLGTGTLTITNGGSYGGSITGGGGIDVSGSTFTLTSADTYSGTTTIDSGAVLELNGGSIVNSIVDDNGMLDVSFGDASIKSLRDSAGPGAVTLGIGHTFTLTAANDTFDGIISGGDATSIFEIATGSETLTGVNTYTGTTQIDNGGVLALSGSGSIAGSAGVDDNGSFNISATTSGATITELYGNGGVTLGSQTLTINNAETGIVATNTFAGAIGGSGGLTIAAGWEELTGTQNYSGATTIDNLATLELGSGAQLSLNSNVEDQGTLILSGDTTIKSLTSTALHNGSVTLGTYTLTIQNASGTFYGDIGVDAAGGGLTIAQGTQTLTGTNAYTGATTINTGATLAIAGSGDISASSGVADSGTFDISGATVAPTNVSITALTGSGSGKVYLGQNTLIVTAASGTFSGVIADAGGIVNVAGGGIEISGGTQTLAGINTYTGVTTIDLGATLAISGSGSIAASSDVVDNGTFDVSGVTGSANIKSLDGTDGTATVVLGSKTLTLTLASGSFAGDISGTGGLAISTGTETLTGANTYSGTTTISSGATLALSGSGSIANSSVADAGTLDITATTSGASIKSLSGTGNVALGSQMLTITNAVNGAAGNFNGVIDDATLGGGIEIAGGTETLQNVNTYSGATIIDNGATLKLSNSGDISTSSGVQADGTFDIHLLGSGTSITSLSGAATGSVVLGFNTLTISNANPLDTFSGVISGSGGLTLTTGTETLAGTNTYTGATTLNGGTLALTGTGSIAASSGVAVGAGATFDISQTTSGASIARLSGSGHADLGSKTLTLTAANDTFSGVIEDGGLGGGTGGGLTVTGTETLSGVNTYTGTTTINAISTINLSGAGSIANSSVTDNGTFDISGIATGSASIVSLSGTGGVTLGGKTLELSVAAGTFSGVIGGTGGLTLDSGTETLSGANTYTGLTTITSGTLALSGTGTIASSSGVADNGTFDISALSGDTSISTLTGSGAVVLGANTLTFTAGGGNTFNGSVSGTGGLAITGGTEKLGATATTTYSGTTTVGGGAQLWFSNSGDASSALSVAGTLNLSGAAGTVSFKSLSGSGTVTLGANTLKLMNASGNYSGGIGGSGGFEIAGGTETLTSSVNYTGATIIDNGASLVLTGAGAIQFSSGVQADGNFSIASTSSGTTIQSLSGASTGTVALGSRTLTLSSGTGTFAGVIGGTGGLNVNGSGTETLSGVNTYSGTTAIGGGETLAITGTGSLANSAVAVTGIFDITGTTTGTSIKSLSGSGTVKLGSKLLTLTNASGIFSGVIEDPVGAGLEIAAGTETLTGVNTYTGHTTIDATATLKLSGLGSIEDSNGVTDNGTFDISGVTPATTVSITTLDGNGSVILGTKTLILTNASGNFAGVISGTGGLEIAGGSETLSGINTFTGTTTIDFGATLTLSGAGSIAGPLVNNGTFNASGPLTAGVLNGSGNLTIATSLELTGPGTGNYSGVLSGAGTFTIDNSVDQTLTGTNTYTGATTIEGGGILRLSGTGSISDSSSVTLLAPGTGPVGTHGTFDISGLTNGGTSIVSLAGQAGTSVTLGANTLTLTVANDTFAGIISGTGGLTISSGTETLTGNNTFTGNTTISGGTLQLGDGTSANGTVGGNIVDNAALKFDYLGTASYGGAISGTGSVEQVAGTTVLTGTNTYNGSTTIDSGATLQIGNGGTAGALSNTSGVTDGGTLAFDRSDNITFGAAISGGGAVEQDGTGTLTLSGTNTYSGGTTINSGAISVASHNNLGGGALNMQNNTTLYITATDSFGNAVTMTGDPTFNVAPATTTTWTGLISGTGDLDVTGGGTLVLTDTLNSYNGGTSVLGGSTLVLDNDGEIGATSGGLTLGDASTGGTLKLGASFNLAGTRAVALGAGGGTIDTNGFNTTVSQAISGSGSLTKSGTGTLTLSAANSYTGATTISGGTLALTGSGSVSTSSGVADNATFDISGITAGSTAITSLSGNGGVTLGAKTLEISSASGTFSGIIGGTGGLTLDAGTETLSGANSYTGLTTISGGTLALSGTGSISNSSGVADSGTFDISALTGAGTSITTLSGNGAVVLGAKTLTLTAASGSFGGSISGTGALVITGGTETLTASSTFTGGTTVSGGATLILSADNELGGATSGLTLNNGTLQFAASFDLASTRAFALGAGGGTVNTNGFNSTVSQAISGSGALTKTGTGTLTLAAANTYTGTTTISAGTLALTGSGSIAASSSVTDNATFDITGTTSGASIEGLSGSGSVLAAGKTLTITNSGGTFSGVISGSGANLEVSGGTTTLSGANTYDGNTTIDSGATLALTGTGSIASSSGVADAGTFNISGTTSGGSITTLSGNGAVTLGAQTLTLTAASGTFSGAIGGTGGLTLSAGNETLSGTNIYSGATTINGGTLSISSDSNLGGGALAINNGGTLATTATNTHTHAATLTGTAGLSVASATTATWNAAFSGSGSLNVTGGGTLILGVANTYSGGTSVAGGSTLSVTADNELGGSSGGLTLGDASTGGTLKLGASFNLAGTRAVALGAGGGTINTNGFNTSVSQTISGIGGSLTKSGTGTLTLTAANAYTGTTTISTGTLALAGSGSVSTSSGVADNATFDISGITAGSTAITSLSGNGGVTLGAKTLEISSASGTFSGIIGGTGGLTLDSGTETLSGANSYTGLTTISGGTLALSGTGSISNSSGVADDGTFDISGVTIAPTTVSITTLSGSGSVVLGSNTLILTNASSTFSGVISGAGGLEIAGGTETLTGANTYTGATTIDTGATLILSGSGSLSSGSTLIIASGGTFDASGSSATSTLGALSGSGNLVLGSGGLELTGGTGSYSGVLSGTGGLTVDNGVDQTLTGANTYTGATVIDAGGSLSLTGTGSIADSSGVTDNGTFDISGLTNGGTTITSLSGSGNVELGSNTLTLSNASGTFSGVISDPAGGSLVVAGGTEILTGANTYTGGTTIDPGATLQLGDGTSTSGSLTSDVTDNGTFAFDYDGASSFGGAITGTGHVSLIAGTLTLTGTNNYSGGTAIGADSTLIVAGQSNLGSGAITMADGSALNITATGAFANNVTVTGDPTFNVAPATTTTWNGNITGAGDVVVIGGGTLVLTDATNSYTLGTVVEDGSTLQIGADGDIGNTAGGLTLGDASTSGTLKLGGSFNLASTRAFSLGAGGGTINTNTFNTTVSQAITGSGALTKTGTGTLVLAANNIYGGGTTISAGTLQLGNGTSTAGSVTGNILDNAALAFDYSGTALAYSGVISGSGTLTQMAGTTVLTGTNTYTGLTTISGGTLQIGNGGTAGSIDTTSGITDNGTLAFNRTDAVTFDRMVSGTGGLTQLGSGTLTLTANNTFTGTTTISAGTLSIGNGGTTGAVGGNISIGSGAFAVFNRSNAYTYAGVISGSGTLKQDGSGTLTLSGTSTSFTGPTKVEAGTLSVTGSISNSAVDVGTGTTLAGTGTVGSTTVENGATLSPGVGNIGTLNVTGTIHFASTSNYAVDVSGTSATADKVIVSGAATIDGGEITLTNLGGSYLPGQQFTLLTASSVGSHAFTLVGADAFGPNLHGTLDYSTATAIILKLKLKDLLPILQAHDPNATRNETSVITAIDHANDAGDTLPASFLNLPSLTSSGQLGAAADQMSGEVGAAIPQVATSLISPFMTTMFDHMTSLSIGNDGTKAGSIAGPGPMPAAAASYAGFRDIHDKLGVWVSGFGGDGSTTGVATGIGSTDVNMTTAGISGGVDFHVSPYFMMGASLMGGHTSFDLSGQRGKGDSNAFEGGLYGLVHGTGFYVAAAGAYSSQSMSTDRTVVIPSVTPTAGDHLSSSFTATDYGGRLETGVYVNWLTPYIAVQTLSFHSPAYSEKGTAPSTDFALSYDALSMTTTRFELGTGFGTDMRMASNSIVNMWGRVAWAHDLIPDQKTDVAFSGLPGSGFTIYGAQPASDSALVSLGAIVKGKNGLDFMARVDSDISGPSKSYIGTLGLNFTW